MRICVPDLVQAAAKKVDDKEWTFTQARDWIVSSALGTSLDYAIAARLLALYQATGNKQRVCKFYEDEIEAKIEFEE